MLLTAHRTPRTAQECRELVTLGVGMFEVDVQLRPGGDTVYVSHYLPVGRHTRWLQHDNARVRLGYGPPHDATLADTLARIPGECDVLLDPKAGDAPAQRRLAVALAAQLPDTSRFVVSTDHEVALQAYAAAGFRTWRTIKDRAALRAALEREPCGTGVSVRHSVLDEGAVAALHERLGTVVAWTVNRVERARQLRDLGVDGITTDRREVLAAVRPAE